MALTSKQRSHLKSLAHHLEPVVRVGRGGASDSVVSEVERTIDAHVLIKIRIELEDSSDRKAIAQEIAHQADAEVVGSVGKITILYRARKENPSIRIPE